MEVVFHGVFTLASRCRGLTGCHFHVFMVHVCMLGCTSKWQLFSDEQSKTLWGKLFTKCRQLNETVPLIPTNNTKFPESFMLEVGAGTSVRNPNSDRRDGTISVPQRRGDKVIFTYESKNMIELDSSTMVGVLARVPKDVNILVVTSRKLSPKGLFANIKWDKRCQMVRQQRVEKKDDPHEAFADHKSVRFVTMQGDAQGDPHVQVLRFGNQVSDKTEVKLLVVILLIPDLPG